MEGAVEGCEESELSSEVECVEEDEEEEEDRFGFVEKNSVETR